MPTSKYPNEIKINPNRCGKAAIDCLVEAYGFTTRQALVDHFGISKSTLTNRYMRVTFPADYINQYALETGTSLNWLITGNGCKQGAQAPKLIEIEKRILESRTFFKKEPYIFDRYFPPRNFKKLVIVISENSYFIYELSFDEIRDGNWVVNIDGKKLIRTLTRLQGNCIHIDGGDHPFDCATSNIDVIAKIIISCNKKRQNYE